MKALTVASPFSGQRSVQGPVEMRERMLQQGVNEDERTAKNLVDFLIQKAEFAS